MSSDPEFAGFLSYVRTDDDDGGISALCEALEREVRLQLGRPFQIFRDVEDVRWGQRWKRRIDDTLDNASVLIPVITPGFFSREECRREVERFLQREKQLGRDELIFPIHYVETRPGDDDLAKELFARQMADWRPLRLEPLTSQPVRKRLAELASRIRDVFGATSVAPSVAPAQSTGAESREPAPPANEPPTIVVDPLGRLGPRTIYEAIELSEPGMRILVQPGLYDKPLVIEHPLELIGQGAREEIVIRVTDGNALVFRTNFGRVSNLTIHRAGTGERRNDAVWVAQGRLELEECDLRSDAAATLYVSGGADPRVRGNIIHDGANAGILVLDQALGTYEDNEVFGNALAAVEARDGANPTVRRNRLRDSRKASCIFVHDGGAGTYEGNEISGGARRAVELREAGNPTVRSNRIIGNAGGIRVHRGGGGVFEDNEIEGPWPWDVADDCVDNVIARGNTPEWTKS